jgi:hypothetical protein
LESLDLKDSKSEVKKREKEKINEMKVLIGERMKLYRHDLFIVGAVPVSLLVVAIAIAAPAALLLLQ